MTSNPSVYRQLSLVWGVFPVLGEKAKSTDHMLEITVDAAVKSGMIKQGKKQRNVGKVKQLLGIY